MLFTYTTPNNTDFSYPNIGNDHKVIYADKDLRIRTMSLHELVQTRDNWLVPEGWPGIKCTLGATYASDPLGFYLLEKDGQKIASISLVTYPEINLAYIGFYLVIKSMRGKGF